MCLDRKPRKFGAFVFVQTRRLHLCVFEKNPPPLAGAAPFAVVFWGEGVGMVGFKGVVCGVLKKRTVCMRKRDHSQTDRHRERERERETVTATASGNKNNVMGRHMQAERGAWGGDKTG